MLLQEERCAVVEYGKKLLTSGLTTGSGGNVSVCNRPKGLFALSPSSMEYGEIRPEDVVVLDLDGNVVDGVRRPSTEIEMHTEVYRARPDVRGIVHTHSVYATAIACMGWDLEPLHYLLAMGGPVVKCAPYTTYGTKQLADYAVEALEGRAACLLGNHGLLAVGQTVQQAFSTAEHLEYVAQLNCITKSLGQPKLLTPQQIGEVMDKFGTNPYK